MVLVVYYEVQTVALVFLCSLSDESSGTCTINSLFLLMDTETMTASIRWPPIGPSLVRTVPCRFFYSSRPRTPSP